MRKFQEDVLALEHLPQVTLTIFGDHVYCIERFVVEWWNDFDDVHEVRVVELLKNHDLAQNALSVDLIIERGNEIAAVEIKSGMTVASDAFGNLKKWQKYAAERGSFSAVYPGLVYGGNSRFTREGAVAWVFSGFECVELHALNVRGDNGNYAT